MNRLPALAAYAALLCATAPPWPDDWDGVGFVASVHDFDLARFHPHPPGYPVYVALLRAAAVVVGQPMRACVLVAALSGALAIAFLWDGTRRFAGERAAWAAGALVGAAPLVWRACSGVGSESPALACAAACAWGLVAVRDAHGSRAVRTWGPIALALGAGLGIGVRLSWAPLFLAALALAPPSTRARAWLGTAAATLAWAVPLVAIVGARRLVALYATHFAGHAERWGGTVVTEPGTVRLSWLGRDAFVDGLGAGRDVLGLTIAALLAIAAAQAILAWRDERWRGWRTAVWLTAPYLTWIALGQNLRDQPRHALPLVAIVAAALALPAARSRRAFALVATLALAVAMRTACDAHARRTIPPAGEQLVELARAQPDPDRVDVFGIASIRFFESSGLATQAFAAGSIGDVESRLTRLDRLPARVWVTSEIQGRGASRWPLVPVATLCRPSRIDRRAPCLDVYDWKLPYLPAR